MILDLRSRQGWALLVGCAIVVPLLLGQGCPGIGGSVTGGPTVVVRAPSLNQTVSAGQLITIVYDAYGSGTVTVNAFYDRDGVAGSGDEVVFGTNLATGQSKFTQLSTAGISAGVIHVGISALNSSGTTVVYASATATISSSPVLTFTSPAAPLTVGPGTIVPVNFNAGAGVVNFSYRTFYDANTTYNGDEMTILTGTSTTSEVRSNFDTTGMSPGSYYVGVRISTSTGGTVTAYAPGSVALVTGAFVQVLEPTVGIVAVPGTQIQVRIAASDVAQTNSTIRIFYDADNTFGNGNETAIATIPATGSGTVWNTTGISTGSYYVGAELRNGTSPPPVSYSAGPVELVSSATGGQAGQGGAGSSATLTITTPQVATTVLAGTVYRVLWLTTLLPGEGVITVFREPDLNADGQPDGSAARVTIGNVGMDAATQFVDFDTTNVRGTFFIGATVTVSATGEQSTAYAAGTLTVQPLWFWVGDLRTKLTADGVPAIQSGAFQGAVFRGHNIGDNLGSAMIGVDDMDTDGSTEILIAAQFGKPFNLGLDGRGAGEAYLIYGAGRRYSGDYNVNNTGQASLPGVLMTGIVPNPLDGGDLSLAARAGSSIPYAVDGTIAGPYATEGLRSLLQVPDQDGDGKKELVFGFPYCNSFSLSYQVAYGTMPDRLPGVGRLENNGHFLRGGMIMVSSRNPLINNRLATSRRLDRVLELQEVGQMFNDMTGYRTDRNYCPRPPANPSPDAADDTVDWPCDGFWQDTAGLISPPRLAEPTDAGGLIIDVTGVNGVTRPTGCGGSLINLTQVDVPLGSGLTGDPFFVGGTSAGLLDSCATSWPAAGFMHTMGTGMYRISNSSTSTNCVDQVMANPLEPFGCRILGQTTTQPLLGTTANRFGASLALSGDFLLIGAPLRTPTQVDVPSLPTAQRDNAGQVYMLQLMRPGAPVNEFPYVVPLDAADPATTASTVNPYPHNWIIQDVGYSRTALASSVCALAGALQNSAAANIRHPFHIVGAAPGDEIGEVTGLRDINGDGVDDFAVGGPQTNAGRGAIYVIYRRQPEVEGDYLLERLQYAPSNLNRLNGLMIIGEAGEQLGGAIGGGGTANDDYNGDGKSDLVIGSPNSSPTGAFHAGQVFVLFGGKNLLSPAGGSTMTQLRASGDGMLLTGAHAGDVAGTTVATAGDVNGDGVADLLIAAPDASPTFLDAGGVEHVGLDYNGDDVADDLNSDGAADAMTNAGLVYVVFGGEHLAGTISLSQIGTKALPGFVLVGRSTGDRLGGGLTQSGLLSRGISCAGDIDGDQRSDLMVSSVLASPDGKTNAGEVYLVYGFKP